MISWCFDQIERMVNKSKEAEVKLTDTISNNTSAMELEMKKAQAKYQFLQQAQAAHQYPYNQYGGLGSSTGVTWTTNGTGVLGGAGIGTPLPTIYTTASPAVWQSGVNVATPYIPGPSGFIANVMFTDANGYTHHISVDSSFVHLIDQISHAHRSLRQYINPVQNKPSLPDPDFSLDDLGVAEELIEEMNGTAGK